MISMQSFLKADLVEGGRKVTIGHQLTCQVLSSRPEMSRTGRGKWQGLCQKVM